MVPPHPKYNAVPQNWYAAQPEMYLNIGEYSAAAVADFPQLSQDQTREIPQNILVLMVQFSDVQFKTDQDYPEYLNHDQVFFERWMLHLKDYFHDASHGRYQMEYTVHPQVYTLPHPMRYYGNDSEVNIDENLPFILQHLMPLCDEQIDFSDYEGLIIFHAGAGQEADIDEIRTDNIWSTFLTRRTLQEAYDPDNDEYPGFITGDGTILTNVVIVPEDEYQDYFPGDGEENASAYLFSIYGVLAHQFAHVLGLPTLFDNDSSDGRSQGIGNWGLMGTGVWNASGYVPAQLSAWSRYYLGWEDAITIYNDADNLPLHPFLDHQDQATRLYRIPITEHEYFLIENRQQNPDGSLDPYESLPSYSFKLLAEGEQDYYEEYPELPYFNFMENRYTGCEWDFFLPGFGMSPLTDGSGILIWHIDEHVIAENFSSNFDVNRVNANARHKGIDLEEADGLQHLDTSVLMDEFKYGGPDDSFRSGNNDYFGNGVHQGFTWLPTSESYYGGVPLEIFDISESGNTMYFSVSFAWKLEAGYSGINTLPAAAIDLDQDGNTEIFYPMPSGKLAMFSQDAMSDGYPIQVQDIPYLYTWNGSDMYIPIQVEGLARLYRMNADDKNYELNMPTYRWIGHPVDLGEALAMPMRDSNDIDMIRMYAKNGDENLLDITLTDARFMANLSWTGEELYSLIRSQADDSYHIWWMSADRGQERSASLELPADSLATAICTYMEQDLLHLIVQCPSSLYVYEQDGENFNLKSGFPFVLADSTSSPVSICDIDRNGSLDLILATSNRLYIIDQTGSNLALASLELGMDPDAVAAGVLVQDLDGDLRPELAGAFSFNRMVMWEETLRIASGYPVSFGARARFMPFVSKGEQDTHYLWQATDRGYIYRKELPNFDPAVAQPLWNADYADLRRTAHHPALELPNQYLSDDVFVEDQTYIFPNPLKPYYEQVLRLHVMPTEDMMVEMRIFDISGNLVYETRAMAYAYQRNMESFEIPADKMSSGIYIAIVEGGGKTLQRRFGIEK